MKVFCYFVEPALYTLDLAKNIYVKNNIDYGFINSNTLVKSEEKTAKIFLDNLTFFSKLKFLITTYKNNDFIIVNGYNNYPFIVTFILNLFSFNRKYIATESDTQFSIPKSPLKRFVKWIYLSIIFRNKYILGFAGGSFSHKDLFRHYGMKENRIFLMPMMVDNSKFYQEEKLFPEIFTFLYVGRLVKHKNAENLIQQFNQNFSDKSAVLKIIGSGEQENYLKNKYSSQKVIFLGKLFNDDLIAEFKNASCFVCPSEFEPWGLVVNEALSSALPVITTKEVGAGFDLIVSKETGLVANNMDEFGECMLHLYNDADLLMRFSKNASDLMRNHWNYALYDKCLQDAIKKVEQWQ
ncbi:MAG: glycosyltransferase family 4 protein [Pelagibacterales bacterium]|nr:glycosyltransferase family 4 protein [Pelagibacterales bacterium]